MLEEFSIVDDHHHRNYEKMLEELGNWIGDHHQNYEKEELGIWIVLFCVWSDQRRRLKIRTEERCRMGEGRGEEEEEEEEACFCCAAVPAAAALVFCIFLAGVSTGWLGHESELQV